MLKKLGIILCRVTDIKTYAFSNNNGKYNLAKESTLMLYGYNVNRKSNLKTVDRQKILAAIIDWNILTKSEILSYLKFFISQKSGDVKYNEAIDKWTADQKFVANYKIGNFKQFGVNAIYI
ncbi:hypothetical protein P261_02638 [Lachnospiraceae bacterium TWA4]|nr:hypothetical protein P261_02638 [Lachnospiraceae bacterium TWA4]